MKLSAILALTVAFASVSCVDKPTKDEEIAAALANRPPRDEQKPLAYPGAFTVLAVLAGQGAGPIRLGANIAQVQRLMQAPCEIRSENLCRYARRGMDYNLVGGLTQSIYIQRSGRPAGRSATGENLSFGFFQGMIPPDLRLGMLPEAIQQYLGKPRRITHVPGPNPQNMVERHEYPGMTLEYDWWPETQKLILGGILIFKDPTAVPNVIESAARAADGGVASDAGAPAPVPSGKQPGDAGAPRVREPEPR